MFVVEVVKHGRGEGFLPARDGFPALYVLKNGCDMGGDLAGLGVPRVRMTE